MIRVLICMVLFFVGFNNCSKKTDLSFIDDLNNATEIKGEIIPRKQAVLQYMGNLHYNNGSLIGNSGKSSKLLAVFSLKKGQITGKFCRKGNGPQELLGIGNMQVISSDSIYVYDILKNRLYFLNPEKDTLITKLSLKDKPTSVLKLNGEDNYFICGIFPDARFKLFEKNNIVFNYKTFPEIGTEMRDTIFLNLGYGNRIVKHPSKNIVANIVRYSEIIECYNIKNNEIKLKWNHELSMAELEKRQFEGGAVNPRTSPEAFGFKEIYATEDHVFCLYTNKKVIELKEHRNVGLADYVFVFDWEDGNLINVYKLDHLVGSSFAISEDGKFLYSYAVVADDYEIIRYRL